MALQISPQHCLLEQYNKSPMKSAVSPIIDMVVIVFICKDKKLNSVPLSSRPPKFLLVTLQSRIPAPSNVCFTDPGSLITSFPFGLNISSTCWTVLWKGYGIPSRENSIQIAVPRKHCQLAFLYSLGCTTIIQTLLGHP